MANAECSDHLKSDSAVPVKVRRLNGELQIVNVNLETSVEELRTTLVASLPDDGITKLFLNSVELRGGSCADAGLVEGAELTCVQVPKPDASKFTAVSKWAMLQRCRLDMDFKYNLEQAMDQEGHDVDIEDFMETQDDKRCLDDLAYLSEWNLEEEDCQTLLDHLDGLAENGGREDDDNWTVEMAMARCIGRCCPPMVFAPKLTVLCARSMETYSEFTTMAVVIAISELCRRKRGALPQELVTLLLQGLVDQDWMSQDDCSDDEGGDYVIAKHAVFAVCHLAAEFGDPALLRRLQTEVVVSTAAKDLLTQSVGRCSSAVTPADSMSSST